MTNSPKNNSSQNQSGITANSTSTDPTKTTARAGRYIIIGISLAIFNYGLYAILSNLIIKNNGLLWLSTFISTAATTILAYILHSKITWKERPITKTAIYKFLIWNALLAVAIGPWTTQLFSLITPLYQFAYNIFQTLHIPFSYDFTLTTGAFILTSIVTMILNFFFYDRFVFGKSKPNSHNQTKNMIK